MPKATADIRKDVGKRPPASTFWESSGEVMAPGSKRIACLLLGIDRADCGLSRAIWSGRNPLCGVQVLMAHPLADFASRQYDDPVKARGSVQGVCLYAGGISCGHV